MSSLQRLIPALVICILTITGCGIQKPAPKQAITKPAAHSADRQQMAINNMDPRFLYLASQQAADQGNHQLAIQLLTALVKKDPQAITPHIQLAGLLLQTGNRIEAKKHITALLAQPSLKPEQFELLELSRIRLLVSNQHEDQALDALQAFLKTRPAHVAARDIQARLLANQNRIDDALNALEVAILTEERPEFRLLQAQLLLKKNDLIAARIALKRMLMLDPANDTATIMLSGIALKEERTEAAENLLRQFIASYPDAIRASHALGKILIEQNRIAEAILVYRDADAQSNGNPDILKSLGMLYYRFKELDKAEETFLRLLQTHPTDSSRFFYATSLEAQQKNDKARAIYESIKADSKTAVEAQVRLAGMDFNAEQLQKAEERLLRVLKGQPTHMEAIMMLTGIWITQRKYRTLVDKTEYLMSETRLHPQILFNRAVAFDYLKQHGDVESTLNRVLDKHPEHNEALNFLGYNYAVQGIKLDRAESLIKRALKQKPDDGYYLDSLAWVYFKRGEFIKAMQTQKKALEIIADDAIMFEHYGDILWANSKQEAARLAWKEALKLGAENSKQLKRKITDGPGS